MKDGTELKVKFLMLQRDLDLEGWQAQGLITAIWRFAKANTPQGDIGRFSNKEIALGIDWRNDPEKMIAALVENRWLDAHEEHRLVVHDWHEHCEDTIHVHLARKRLLFADGQVPKLTRFAANEKAAITADYKRICEQAISSGKKSRKSTRKPAPSLAKPSLAIPSQASSSSEPAEPASEPPDVAPLMTFPTVGEAQEWHLTQPVVDTLATAFPHLDILAESRRALAWAETNPTKRKTPRGMPKFLNGWMERAQNSGRAGPSRGARPAPDYSLKALGLDYSDDQ